MPVDVDVDREVTLLFAALTPVESDVTPLCAVLIPVDVDVDSEATPLLALLKPVDSELTPL